MWVNDLSSCGPRSEDKIKNGRTTPALLRSISGPSSYITPVVLGVPDVVTQANLRTCRGKRKVATQRDLS